MSAVKKQSLAEQLAELSNPKPGIFPEDDVPKICDFDEYEETTPPVRMTTRRNRREIYLEDDPRYAGRAISRKEMEELEGELLFCLCIDPLYLITFPWRFRILNLCRAGAILVKYMYMYIASNMERALHHC